MESIILLYIVKIPPGMVRSTCIEWSDPAYDFNNYKLLSREIIELRIDVTCNGSELKIIIVFVWIFSTTDCIVSFFVYYKQVI